MFEMRPLGEGCWRRGGGGEGARGRGYTVAAKGDHGSVGMAGQKQCRMTLERTSELYVKALQGAGGGEVSAVVCDGSVYQEK